MRKLHVFALAAIALAACAGPRAEGYSGTVQAPNAAVGSTLGGRIASVMVSEGTRVRRGAILVRFDDAQLRASVASAQARLSQARAALADLQAGARPEDLARAKALADQQRAEAILAESTTPYQVSVARNAVRQALAQQSDAQAAAREARVEAARLRTLFASGDVSAQMRDAAVAREAHANAGVTNAAAAVRTAQAQAANAARVTLPQRALAAQSAYRAAEEQYRALAAGARPEQIRSARAAEIAAEGDVAAARARLDETVVRAPADGVVTAMDLHAGDLVAPGASVATIDEAGEPHVRIFVPQAQLGRLAVGAKVAVRSDAGGARYDGIVEQVDAQAQFTPQNVQTESDRAVLAFGVKVRIHDSASALHPGTTVVITLP